MDKKNTMLLTVIAVATLLVAVVGATFAYFSVTGGNTSTSTTVTGSVGGVGGTVGAVTLTGGGKHLYLAVTASDMAEQKDADGNTVSKTYYSVSTADSRAESLQDDGKTTYTAKLSGVTDDTVTYACDYTFKVTTTGTMTSAASRADVKLVVTGDIATTQSLGSTSDLTGTWTGIKFSSDTRTFDAYLTLTNTDQPQNDLAGTGLELVIENTQFECYPE